jgi:hypothetical protein
MKTHRITVAIAAQKPSHTMQINLRSNFTPQLSFRNRLFGKICRYKISIAFTFAQKTSFKGLSFQSSLVDNTISNKQCKKKHPGIRAKGLDVIQPLRHCTRNDLMAMLIGISRIFQSQIHAA